MCREKIYACKYTVLHKTYFSLGKKCGKRGMEVGIKVFVSYMPMLSVLVYAHSASLEYNLISLAHLLFKATL